MVMCGMIILFLFFISGLLVNVFKFVGIIILDFLLKFSYFVGVYVWSDVW